MTQLLLIHGSYFAIFFVLVLTGAGLPVPEEIPIIAAGVMASHGQLDPWLALASCLLGVLAGDCLMYAIGRRFGSNLVREHPFWARFVKPDREAQIEEMIRRHGLKVFFLTRFLVGLRSPVYLTAGILRMPFKRFLVIDLSCATLVVGTFFLLSFHFGQTITRWIQRAEILVTGGVLLAVAIAVVYLIRRHRRRPIPTVAGTSARNPLSVEGAGGKTAGKAESNPLVFRDVIDMAGIQRKSG